ncbi:hypothetical protein F7725_001429 [Dissostichus mawsoni]|uniref:Uncharacterized protein n=1 Tax=Dissostichus mawsoni TaxID=36200 RepID=A0A7J5ZH90_DISMA|nr:hypothetical protein F7725_001429 [Dissostichus mawsoni]
MFPDQYQKRGIRLYWLPSFLCRCTQRMELSPQKHRLPVEPRCRKAYRPQDYQQITKYCTTESEETQISSHNKRSAVTAKQVSSQAKPKQVKGAITKFNWSRRLTKQSPIRPKKGFTPHQTQRT